MDEQRDEGKKPGRMAEVKRTIKDAFETGGAGGVVPANLIGRNPLVDARVADEQRRRSEDDKANDRD